MGVIVCLTIDNIAEAADLGIEPGEVSPILVSHQLDFWTGPLARRAHFAIHAERPEVLPGVRAIGVGGTRRGSRRSSSTRRCSSRMRCTYMKSSTRK
jgi:hypothetical protein